MARCESVFGRGVSVLNDRMSVAAVFDWLMMGHRKGDFEYCR